MPDRAEPSVRAPVAQTVDRRQLLAERGDAAVSIDSPADVAAEQTEAFGLGNLMGESVPATSAVPATSSDVSVETRYPAETTRRPSDTAVRPDPTASTTTDTRVPGWSLLGIVPRSDRLTEEPADLGGRFMAALVDGLVVLVGTLPITLVLFWWTTNGFPSPAAVLLLRLLAVAAGSAYLIAGWAKGQTLGKRTLKIAVVDEASGGSIGPGPAAIRCLVLALMGLPCFLGYVSIFLDHTGRRRGWHELAAKSCVVRVLP